VAKARRPLDPALEALVRKRLEEDEIVLDWIELPSGEVLVRLIRNALHQICASSTKKFGRGAGHGRSLQFVLRDGEWMFQGVGGWVS